MPSDRFARVLLRLYPRAWRQRYGDEVLALIADGGLSWREVADVIGAAGVERARAIVALVRNELDPETSPPQFLSIPFREAVRESGLFIGLMATMVGVLMLAGLARPPWVWWYFTITNGTIASSMTARPDSSWAERASLSFLWNVLAVMLVGLARLFAGVGREIGVPEPSDPVFWWSFVLFFGGFCCRAVYCGFRNNLYGSRWRGLTPLEVNAWRLGLFAITVLFAFVDPKGEAFWSTSMIMTFGFRTPRGWSRSAAERRRAAFEEAERFWSK